MWPWPAGSPCQSGIAGAHTLQRSGADHRLLVCGALVLTARQCLRIRALQRQRLDLEGKLAVEDLRRDFVATLAHDLKTPILGTIAILGSLAGSETA